MRDRKLANIESQAVTWLIVFTLIGYPLVALIPSVFDKVSTFASVPYRLGILTLALVVFVIQFMRDAPALSINLLLKLFITFYLFRMIWDLVYMHIPNASYAFLFFIVVCMLPAVAIGKSGTRALNECKLALRLIVLGTVVCGVAVTTHLLDIKLNRSLMAATGRLSFDALNPISLSYVAVTTLVAFVWLSIEQRWSVRLLSALSIVTLPALLCLLLAASRGPIVALELSLLWLFLRSDVDITKRCFIVLLMTAIFFMIFFNNDVGIGSGSGSGSGSVPRRNLYTVFISPSTDESMFERSLLLKNSSEAIMQSPIKGTSYNDYKMYPHNIFIETAMSLGFLGFLMLISIILSIYKYYDPRSEQSKSILSVLFIEYFISSQFSGSLWGMSELWMLLVLITAQPRFNAVRFSERQKYTAMRSRLPH